MSNDWSTPGPQGDPQAPGEFWAPRPDPTRDRQSAWSDEAPVGASTRSRTGLPPAAWADQQQWAPPTGLAPTAAPTPPYAVLPPPPSHLVWAILFTFLGFAPFGIVAILRATTVKRLWAEGRWSESIAASNSARRWVIAAVMTIPGLILALTTVVMLGVALR